MKKRRNEKKMSVISYAGIGINKVAYQFADKVSR